ncbi:magnesium transporter [Teredinibacter haidensis]|uniref:magnesium transporter n=1 Tax=Teredinibacter haidensis TaxID=2731755 RepID=UPI000948C0FB|nr:magnesium transporter [Teredinibacter haidensis]
MMEFNINDVVSRVLDRVSLLEDGAVADLDFLAEVPNEELGVLLESLPVAIRHTVWSTLNPESYWALLHLLQEETARNLVASLDAEEKELLQQFASPDDLKSLASVLPRYMVSAILQEQGGRVLKDLEQALSYGEAEVGRFMVSRVISALPATAAESVLRRFRKRSNYDVDAVFVVNEEGEYLGRVAVTALLQAETGQLLSDLAQDCKALLHDDDLRDAMQTLDALDSGGWLPVVKEKTLLGAISVRAIVHEVKTELVDRGVSESNSEEEDLFTPVPVAAYRRAIWLGLNLVTAFLASTVIGLFEATLQEVIALAVLMPVVASMGGVAGSQTLTVAVRGLVLNHLNDANIKLVLKKEIYIALINSLIWGVVIALVAFYWFDSAWLGVIICVAIIINSLAAAWSGTYIPFVLKKLSIDPAISGSVILTTVTDVVGFLVFLGLGALIL